MNKRSFGKQQFSSRRCYGGRVILSLIVLAYYLFFPARTYANGKWQQYLNTNLTTITSLPDSTPIDVVFNITKTVLQLLGVIALILVIYGGFEILASSGNPEKVQKGRGVLVWAAIGILVILSSLGIVDFISSVIK